jgi:hypothetical protein
MNDGVIFLLLTVLAISCFGVGSLVGGSLGSDDTRAKIYAQCAAGESILIDGVVYECVPVYNYQTREVIGE